MKNVSVPNVGGPGLAGENTRLFSPNFRNTSRFEEHYNNQTPSFSVCAIRSPTNSSNGRLQRDLPSSTTQVDARTESRTPTFSVSGIYESGTAAVDKPSTGFLALETSDRERCKQITETQGVHSGCFAEKSKPFDQSAAKGHIEEKEIFNAALRILEEENKVLTSEYHLLSVVERQLEIDKAKAQEKVSRIPKKEKAGDAPSSVEESVLGSDFESGALAAGGFLALQASELFTHTEESVADSVLQSSISSQSEALETDSIPHFTKSLRTQKTLLIENYDLDTRTSTCLRGNSARFLSDANETDSTCTQHSVHSAPASSSRDAFIHEAKRSANETKKESFWDSVFKNRNHKLESHTRDKDKAERAAAASAGSIPYLFNPLSCVFKSRVMIVGDQGSGKTSFKACFTSNILKTLPEVTSSTQSSSSSYYFKSESNTKTQQPRILEVTVTDSGPLSLTSGGSTLCADGTLFLMTLSLARIKQKPIAKKIISFGSKAVPEPILLESDKQSIRSHLRSIASVAPDNSAFIFVGTFLDLLTDTSQLAVEAVIGAVRKVIMDELSSERYRIMFRGCFAVSCVDHKVVSDMRNTGPRYISDLWTMLCETMLKDAVSTRGGISIICPSTFVWSAETLPNIGARLGGDSEGELEKASSEIGNLGNSLVAKFIFENVNPVRVMSSQMQSQSRLLPSPSNCDPQAAIENSAVFTQKMHGLTRVFPNSGRTISRVRCILANEKAGLGVNDELSAFPCLAKCQISTYRGSDDVLGGKPKSHIEMLSAFQTPHSTVSLLREEGEAEQLFLIKATNKARLLIERLKNELNIVMTPVVSLRGQLFAIGLQSKTHFNHLLANLVREGQVTFLRDRMSKGGAGFVLFQPHLISRAVFAVFKTAELSAYPLADRKRILPSVDPEEVQLADPDQHLLGKGFLSDVLIVALGSCISSHGRGRSEGAEMMRKLLMLSDFMIQCREAALCCARSPKTESPAELPSVQCSGDSFHSPSTANRLTNYFGRQKRSKLENFIGTRCGFSGAGWVFVVPTLVKKKIPAQCITALRALTLSQNVRGRERKSVPSIRTIYAEELIVTVSPFPSFLKFKLMCRLGNFIRNPECVYADAVWLSNEQLLSRCLLHFTNKDDHSPEQAISVISVGGGSHLGLSSFSDEILKEIRHLVSSELRGVKLSITDSLGGSVECPADPKSIEWETNSAKEIIRMIEHRYFS